MATNRVRTRTGNPIKGYNIKSPTYGGGVDEFSAVTTEAWMRDNTGPKPYADRPMNGWSVTRSGGFINGPSSTGRFENVPSLIYTDGAAADWNTGTDESHRNRILSQSGPQTPRVHLPLFVYELKDIPRMIRHAGDLLHGLKRPSGLSLDKEAAAATLAYQFGWAPLLQDLDRMVKFSETVKRRQEELERAHTTKGLRRKITLTEDSSVTTTNPFVWSTHGIVIQTRKVTTVNVKQWATVRWIVRDQTQIGRKPSFNEAFRSAYGLNRGHIPIQVWKGLPWSWAIDWFGDFSNLLTANYNSIYYRPLPINMMKTTTMTATYDAWKHASNGRQFSAGRVESKRIARTIQAPNTNFRIKLPFLDNFKLSILGSMTILRIRGR